MSLGIDVGGTKIAYGEVEKGLILWKKTIPTPNSKDEMIATLLDIINSYDGQQVGIGIPGQVKNGHVLFTPNIPLSNTPLANILQDKTGKNVIVENDANAFLIAEYKWGAASPYESAIGITLGTGIGGAIIIDGKLWNGAHGAGAEFGHMALMEDGPMCGCGSTGCFEAIASPRSIEKWVETQIKNGFPAQKTSYSLKEIIECRDKEPICRVAYERFVRFLGMGVANLVNILDPDVVVFGGSGVLSWNHWKDDAYAVFRRRVLPSIKDNINWAKAKFLADSGIIGAAAIASP